jgi:hypothetical protein
MFATCYRIMLYVLLQQPCDICTLTRLHDTASQPGARTTRAARSAATKACAEAARAAIAESGSVCRTPFRCALRLATGDCHYVIVTMSLIRLAQQLSGVLAVWIALTSKL